MNASQIKTNDLDYVCKITGDGDSWEWMCSIKNKTGAFSAVYSYFDWYHWNWRCVCFICSTNKCINSSETCDLIFGIYSVFFILRVIFSCVFILQNLIFFLLKISVVPWHHSVQFDSFRFVLIKDLIVQRHLKSKYMFMHEMCLGVPVAFNTTRLLIQRAAAKSTSTEKVLCRWNDWLVFHNI